MSAVIAEVCSEVFNSNAGGGIYTSLRFDGEAD